MERRIINIFPFFVPDVVLVNLNLNGCGVIPPGITGTIMLIRVFLKINVNLEIRSPKNILPKVNPLFDVVEATE